MRPRSTLQDCLTPSPKEAVVILQKSFVVSVSELIEGRNAFSFKSCSFT
jgi:hypothetical protein